MITNKKIFITGAGGFIGTYFLEKLKDENEVIALLRKDIEQYWRLKLFEKNYKVIKGDITESEKIREILRKERPDIVFHFAAYGTYPSTQQEIKNLIDINVIGTVNFIEACLEYSAETIIAGSSSEYGAVKTPMKEDGSTNPIILYGATKLFTTHWAKIRAKQENKKMFVVRPFSVYGPYEEPTRLIPYVLSSAILEKEIFLSSKNNVRDFIFIEDFFNAVNLILEKNSEIEGGEIINIGSGKETTIEELIKIVENQIVKQNLKIKWGKESTQPEICSWYADITKLKKLGFEKRYELTDGLKKTKEWIEKNINYYKE